MAARLLISSSSAATTTTNLLLKQQRQKLLHQRNILLYHHHHRNLNHCWNLKPFHNNNLHNNNPHYHRNRFLSSYNPHRPTLREMIKDKKQNNEGLNLLHKFDDKPLKPSFIHRSELCRAQRVVIKLGSAVITRDDECGVALGRLASIVEEVSELHKEGRDVLMVTSGAVAFGKQKLSAELRMSMSMRETLSRGTENLQALGKALLEARAAAAVGQSGLMALYDAMFAQYGITIAQVLLNKSDFSNSESRHNLATTLFELLKFDIIPIINTNDAVVSPAIADVDLEGVISVSDNDILAAHLAVEVNADALFLLSDVNGIYTKPPSQDGARLLHTYDPTTAQTITFGEGSRVGTGGMESKVNSATWALNRGVSVVICNGMQDDVIANIMSGKRVGTFFTQIPQKDETTQSMIMNARHASRLLQKLSGKQRGKIIYKLAELLEEKTDLILQANERDLAKANSLELSKPLLDRLKLTQTKLSSLSNGLKQIADKSENILGKIKRRTLISNGLELCQLTVPIGVLLVIFESRPDCLPQIAALSIASGNGLLAKGGKEAIETNRLLHSLIVEALQSIRNELSDDFNDDLKYSCQLINTREDVSELIEMDNDNGDGIDLIIPRGSSDLVRSIQEQSQNVPVLGHSEGICHIFIDNQIGTNDDDMKKAIRIVRDSKCDYPSACNAVETLLIHKDLVEKDFFIQLCNELKRESVKIYSGPKLFHMLTFGPPKARNLTTEYGGLELAIEIVDDYKQAIEHINSHGSHHTDVIVTNNDDRAKEFLRDVDSACVFHNCSTRFADGYRFGLGAEVGISTGRIHARGPVGIEGLLTTKWQLVGNGQVVQDFEKDGIYQYEHIQLPIDDDPDNNPGQQQQQPQEQSTD